MQITVDDADLRAAFESLVSDLRDAGGRAYLVGGCVRDAILGEAIRDLDVEVYGLDVETLQSVLSRRFDLDVVGRSFGVLKIRHLAIDVALPRRESKRGRGHRGFLVDGDPHMSLSEAASRRDFTINALAFDPESGELLDPAGGARDLEERRLRHVSEKFAEDPLRVLRGMQMAARFELRADPGTVALCRSMEPEGLAPERIFEEWRKLVLKGRRPSLGLKFLRDSGWIDQFPELRALIHCPQNPRWHPEGDVWIHTLHVMDAFADERLGDAWEDLVVGLACLCHDLGKPITTAFTEGAWRSPGHEEAGEAPTRSFLGLMSEQKKLADEVVPLVREHLRPIALFKAGSGAAAVRRLARRVGRIDRLIRVCRADHRGRPPIPWDGFPAGAWLLERAEALRVSSDAPSPLVLGRHLIALGLKPGRHFGPMLERCFEAQLDGAFADLESGLDYLRTLQDFREASGEG
ncbi:MAG: HD domain-containing protein [Acidobacteriota bacterium]